MDASGNCSFCGQGIMDDQECSCIGALQDRHVARGLEKVEMLFGDGCEERGFKKVTDEQIIILNDAVKKVAYDEILNATYQLGNGIKAKVSKNAKNQVEVLRTNTRTYKLTTEEE